MDSVTHSTPRRLVTKLSGLRRGTDLFRPGAICGWYTPGLASDDVEPSGVSVPRPLPKN